MDDKLNPLEIDFVEYLSERHALSLEKAEKHYRIERQRFNCFGDKRYRQAAADIQHIHQLFYHPRSEADTLEAYKVLAGTHLLGYLSQSFPKSFSERLRSGLKLFKKKQYADFFQFGKRYIKKSFSQKSTVDILLENLSGTPVIVDYGSGLAKSSSAIAQRIPETKIFLVDVDSLVLQFTLFRFRKYNYNFEVIEITPENLYPALPEHNLCLANEVMEHVYEPLKVYENIYRAMAPSGLLFGNFSDHSKAMLHVSPDLSTLREAVNHNYKPIDVKIYRKFC